MNYYTFDTQDQGKLYYTTVKSSSAIVTFQGIDYTPTPIKRSRYVLDTLSAKNNMTIFFPGDHKLALKYIVPNKQRLTVSVADSNGIIFYRGELIEGRWQRNEILLEFAPSLRIKKTIGERRVYQRNCPYNLYGNLCRARKTDISAIVKARPSSSNVIVSFNTGNTNNYRASKPFDVLPTRVSGTVANIGLLTGGLIKLAQTEWWIVNAKPASTDPLDGSLVNIDIQTFRQHALEINDNVLLNLGCRRDVGDCQLIFNNLHNYGGFGQMKRISPFEGGLEA